jgi:hypothetical protein
MNGGAFVDAERDLRAIYTGIVFGKIALNSATAILQHPTCLSP